jgi:hypothetical protein
MIVAFQVNILQLLVNYRHNFSICVHVGDYGISSKYFATLGKIPTDWFRL